MHCPKKDHLMPRILNVGQLALVLEGTHYAWKLKGARETLDTPSLIAPNFSD